MKTSCFAESQMSQQEKAPHRGFLNLVRAGGFEPPRQLLAGVPAEMGSYICSQNSARSAAIPHQTNTLVIGIIIAPMIGKK